MLAALVVAGCGGPRALDTGSSLTAGPHAEPGVIWERDLGRAIEFPPVPVGDDWLVAVTEGPLHRVRGADGEDVWRCKLPAAATGAPALCESVAVVGTESPGDKLVGVDLETGKTRWKVDARGALPATGRRGQLVAAGRGGWVARFEPATGSELWRVRIPGAGWRTPVVRPGEGLVLVSVRPDSVVALSLDEGGRRWAVRVGPWPLLSPNGEGALFAAGEDGMLVRLDPREGGVLARTRLGAMPGGAPVVAGERALMALRDGRLIGLALEDLTPVWSRMLDAPLVSGPAVGGDRIAQSGPRGEVHVFSLATGDPLPRSRHPEKLLIEGAWSGDRLAVGGAKGTLVLYGRTP